MRILMFHAAMTSVAAVAMTNVAKRLREDGHVVGERMLPFFKAEKEPVDLVVVLLTDDQAAINRERLAELAVVFDLENADPKPVSIQLPDSDEKLADFDPEEVATQVDGPKVGQISVEKARAEAIERGLDVTQATTREELEVMLDMTISPAVQAADRRTDETNNQNLGEPRIGVRTSNILPTPNGVAIERQNPEQLRATAAELGIKTSPNMKRETLVTAITKAYAEKVGGPENSFAQAVGNSNGSVGLDESGDSTGVVGMQADEAHSQMGAEQGGDQGFGELDRKSSADLKKIAEDEKVDLKGATSKKDILTAIVDARKEKANG